MYRPNRIGPWPMVNPDRAPYSFGTIATGQSEVVIAPVTPDQTIRDSTASRQMNGTFSVVPVNGNNSVAIALNGSNPLGDLEGEGDLAVQFECFGSIRWRSTGTNHGFAQPFIARNDAATLAAEPLFNAAANYQFLPVSAHIVSIDGGQMSFKHSFILGNFDGTITYTSDPLLLGVSFQNNHSSTIPIAYNMSLGFHKYLVDIDTHDPPRI